jgi:N-acetylglucosaminyl-diphospho-decaprenol L-rhamnosyltransferase
MELSIIITSYKNPEMLKVCVDSIKKDITLKDYEIIISDSDTQEDTEMMMREEYPDVIFFPFKENVGFQHLVKKAFSTAKGKYILILNGDMIVEKDSIEKLLEFIKNDSEAGLVGPQLLNFNKTLQYSCCRYYTPLTIIYRRTFLGKLGFAKKHLDRFLMKDFDHKSMREVDWLMGSALMTKREAIEKVGLMDERFKMYFEDVDWCRRFWENGYRVIYYPQSKMYHYHGRGSADKSVFRALISNRLAWTHISSAIKYFIKYFGKPLPKHN